MFLDYVHCLTAVRSFKYDGFSLQLFQDSVQRLAYQCMIVNNKNFHEKLSVIPWHGDPIEEIIHPPSGLWRGRGWREDWPETVHPSSLAQPAVHG
jgi:hypothetical protein